MSTPTEAINKTVESIQAAVSDVVLERGWALTQLPNKLIWTLQLAGKSGVPYTCYIQIEPDAGQLLFYGVVPRVAAPEERAAAAIALTAINYGLAIGKFELDLTDGELRFGTGVDVRRTILDRVVFENLVDHALDMLDAYTPQLDKFPTPPK